MAAYVYDLDGGDRIGLTEADLIEQSLALVVLDLFAWQLPPLDCGILSVMGGWPSWVKTDATPWVDWLCGL
ncbi:MAG TPA: hypothetical protein V6D46_07800 [Coleofasciculaceae cyanobacterium]